VHLLVATRNPSKLALFRPLFEERGFCVLGLGDVGGTSEAPPETGTTPVDNALAKARAWHGNEHPWVFGDDASLEVDALGGEPGVQARRRGGRFSDNVDDETWLDFLLARLEGVPAARRTARFVAAWALIAPDGSEHIHSVRYGFRIASRRIRPISPGWPISAVRIPADDDLRARVAADWRRWGILDRLLDRREGDGLGVCPTDAP